MLDDNCDALWGVEQIARYINRSSRQAYYLLQQGLIPARKVGVIWVASRSKLDTFLSGEGGR
jgi:hypothetical protein